MTVGTKIQKAIASAESLAADCRTFSLETQDQQAKTTYGRCAEQAQQIARDLKERWEFVKGQEPQYDPNYRPEAPQGPPQLR